MHTILLIAVLLLMFVGLVGSLLPVLPGAPLIFLGAFVYAIFTHFEKVTWGKLLGLGGLTALALVIDYIATAVGVKRLGASWSGVAGALLGAVVGGVLMAPVGVFLAPIGIVIGAIVGAVVGELLRRGRMSPALRAGVGSIVGLVGGMVARIAICVAMVVIFLYAVYGCGEVRQTVKMRSAEEEEFLRQLAVLSSMPEDSSVSRLLLGKVERVYGERRGSGEVPAGTGPSAAAAPGTDAGAESDRQVSAPLEDVVVRLGDLMAIGPFRPFLGQMVVILGSPRTREAGPDEEGRPVFLAEEIVLAEEMFAIDFVEETLALTISNHFSRPLRELRVLYPGGGHLVPEGPPARHLSVLLPGAKALASWRLRAVGEVKRMPSLRFLTLEPPANLHLALHHLHGK